MAENSNKISMREGLRLSWRGMRELHRHVPGLFGLITLHTAVARLSPYVNVWFSAQLINELAGARRMEHLQLWVALTLGSTVVTGLVSAYLKRRKAAVESTVWQRVQDISAKKLLELDYPAMDAQHTHDLLYQVQQNNNWNGWGIGKVRYCYESLLGAAFGIAGAAALTVSLFTSPMPAGKLHWLGSPLMAGAVMALMLGASLLSAYFANRANAHYTGSADGIKEGNRFFCYFGYDILERARAADVRMYRQETVADHYMKWLFFEKFAQIMKPLAYGAYSIFNGIAAMVPPVFTGFIYAFVCLKAWAGAFGIGSVTQYIGALTALSGSISGLMVTLEELRANAVFLRTSFAFQDIPNTLLCGTKRVEMRKERLHEVEFRDVSFRYPGTEHWALRHVSVKLTAGRRRAIVGENGSGKTTFIKLLCRLYDPDEGQILLDGVDIREYDCGDYQRIFSVVFQDFQLLSRPLAENVAAASQYDAARVEACLRDAGQGERLDSLPQGIHTWLYRDLNPDGINVSGGEAQKIAIARALYREAPFIILDEPTAALDPIAEAEIYAQFDGIAGGRTALYISHRLSSCRFCDEILVFERGQLVQRGSHDALVADGSGRYHALWNAQAQYYAEPAGYPVTPVKPC